MLLVGLEQRPVNWALGQREAARRAYDAYRLRVVRELGTDPLPETTNLYRRILRGEAHPDETAPSAEGETAVRSAHLCRFYLCIAGIGSTADSHDHR